MELTKELKEKIDNYFDDISHNELFDKYLNSLPINPHPECIIDIELELIMNEFNELW